jgi:ubiquinone/menaquinone biosynthesis C-methylase UbiE
MDKEYWQHYYEKGEAPKSPSRFAAHVHQTYTEPGQVLIELGCGNGRDAEYLGSDAGLRVVAVDQVNPAANKDMPHDHAVTYIEADFTAMPEAPEDYNVVYSRFTLHSVSHEGQQSTLAWAANALKTGGFLCIEVRGKKNGLYGKGTPVEGEKDAFIYEDHYRRFVALGELEGRIEALGLVIVESSEEKGYAPRENEDDHFIRIVAQKQ